MSPAAGAPIVALGDDLLREVFIRLPACADLLRAAAACKPFLHAARSAPFLRRFRRRHPSSCPRLLGCLLLFPNNRGGQSHHLSTICTPSSSSSSSSTAAASANAGDFALSFLPGGEGGAAWKHLDYRNGRLLLQNLGSSHELAVADPISRRYVSLPAPPAGRGAVVGYGLFADDGDSSEFRVVCVLRDAASPELLRAVVLTSSDLSWADVAGIACQPDLNLAAAAPGAGSRVMQANRSLYWRLSSGGRLLEFGTASMELSVVDLPPVLRDLRFVAVDWGEQEEGVNALHLLTITGFRVEVWAGMAVDSDGGMAMAWRRVEKSMRFHKALTEMIDPLFQSYGQNEVDVIGVAAGLVFFQQWGHLFSIDFEIMELKELLNVYHLGALTYPYTVAWPPSFLNPAGQGG